MSSYLSAAPDVGDVVVVHTTDASRPYTLTTSPDPPQIACGSYDEALGRAKRFALMRRIHIWRRDGETFSQIAESQPVAAIAMEDLLRRVRGEFAEMPGLRLTERQAQRLWGLDARTCADVLTRLVGAGYLVRTSEGRVMKPDLSRADA